MTDVRYKISIDSAAAQTELDRLHNSAITAAGSEDKLAAATTAATVAQKNNASAVADVDAKMEKLRASAVNLSAAIASGTGNTAAYAEELKRVQAELGKASGSQLTMHQRFQKLPDILGKQAAAISLVSSSLSGMGGNVGKAVAGAGQMAAAFGAGGPFALALVGGIALISAITGHYEDLEKAQQVVIDNDDKIIDAARARRDIQVGSTASAAAEMTQLASINAARARGHDVEARRVEALGTMQVKYLDLVKRIAEEKHEVSKTLLNQELKALGQEMTTRLEIVNATVDAEKGAERRSKSEEKIKAAAEATAHAMHDQVLATQQAQRESDEAMRAPSSTDAVSMMMMGFGAETSTERTLATIMKQHETEAILREHEKQIQNKEWADAEMQRSNEVFIAGLQESESTLADIAKTGAGIVASASGQLIADLVVGQEQAFERFGLSIMAQAGQALVSYGTQALGAAALSALTLNFPVAGMQAAGGAGLIAAGAALGGVASGVSGGLSGGSSQGASARGPSPRSGSGGSQQGGMPTTTIIYAPSRDTAAAAVAVAGTNGAARGFGRERAR